MGLLSMVVKQVGAISEKIDGISTKLNENAATTPAAKATPAGSTTQTADEAKKEGTN